MQKQYTINDFYNLEYYNKLRCADGDVVQYIAKSVKLKKHFLITVKNDKLLNVELYEFAAQLYFCALVICVQKYYITNITTTHMEGFICKH